MLTGYHHVPRVVRTRVFICREQTADVPAHPRILLASRDDTPRHAILLLKMFITFKNRYIRYCLHIFGTPCTLLNHSPNVLLWK